MPQTKVKIVSLFLSVLAYPYAYALPEDKNEVIHVKADSADLNHQKHYGTYKGHVELDQGSTHVRASEAVTEGNAKNQLTKAIAKGTTGEQAHYWALTEKDKPPFHAYADAIYYYPGRHLIELVGNAKVEQGNDSFSAPKIRYHTEEQHVITESDGKGKTVIIIHPEKKNESVIRPEPKKIF